MMVQRERWSNSYSVNIAYNYHRKNFLKTEVASTDFGSNVIQDTINDRVTRNKLWKLLFENEQMPVQEDDAVDKYAGSLRSEFPNVSDEDIEEAIRDAKDK